MQYTETIETIAKDLSYIEIEVNNFQNTNKGAFVGVQQEILQLLNLENFEIVYTDTGSNAIDTILRVMIDKQSIVIMSEFEHPSVVNAANKYCGNICKVPYSLITKTNDLWNIKNTEWFSNILHIIHTIENINTIFICLIGTHSLSGNFTPTSFIDHLISTIKIYVDSSITVYTMIDSCHELFLMNRDYSKYDFFVFTSHLTFGIQNLAFFGFNKNNNVITTKLLKEEYTSQYLIDKGHNPLALGIIKLAISSIQNALATSYNVIYNLRDEITEKLKLLEAKYDVSFSYLSYNDLFPHVPHLISFWCNEIDISGFDNKKTYIYSNFYKNNNVIIEKYLRLLSTHVLLMGLENVDKYFKELECFIEYKQKLNTKILY